MAKPNESLEAVKGYADDNELDLSWIDTRGDWRVTATPDSSRGLTLDDIQIGGTANVPEFSDNMTGHPRGAASRGDAYRAGGYQVRSKSDIWLTNAGCCAKRRCSGSGARPRTYRGRRSSPCPMTSSEPSVSLPRSSPRSSSWRPTVPGKWVSNTSPDFFEPRMFLITQIMDESRHLDVFRKRALANGGGLTQRPDVTMSGVVGGIDLARDFTEMSSRLHISGEGAALTISRMGELMAYNEAEKRIYRLAGQDESRRVAFGVMHMRYLAETQPDRAEEIHAYLDEGERALMAGNQNPAARDTAQSEALAVLLGGGVKHFDEGYRKLLAIRKRQAREYVQRIRSAGYGERFESGRALPELMEYVRGES